MFASCYSLASAPATLPATVLAESCYSGMFSRCVFLTSAPALPATTLANSCYKNMFYNCIRLTSMDVSFTAWDAPNATMNWVFYVAASGTFTCPSLLPQTPGVNNIPSGWTIVEK